MMPEIDQTDVKQRQSLLKQHCRNLNHLEQQAAQYGLDVPLAIHNALTAEQEAIAVLERELAASGVSPRSESKWQALIIDTDNHWREIIAKNIGQLGGTVVEHHAFPRRESYEIIETSTVAIVGVPDEAQTNSPTGQWIEDVVKLGHSLPIILLASWDNKDTVIALRRTIYEGHMNVTPVTIFKENFDPLWFSRVVHKILTH